MSIKIVITAETPDELAHWYARLSAGISTDSAVVAPIDVAQDNVTNAMVKAMVEEPAPAPTPEPAKRGRKPKEEAKPADAPLGPDAAAKAVHDHVPAEHKTGAPAVDIEACKVIMRRVSEEIAFEATRALLTKFGTAKLSQLDPGRYADFVAEGERMLAEASKAA